MKWMTDIDKIIKTLESILDADIYEDWLSEEDRQNICDAISLLKKQDAEVEWCARCGRVRLKSRWERQ